MTCEIPLHYPDLVWDQMCCQNGGILRSSPSGRTKMDGVQVKVVGGPLYSGLKAKHNSILPSSVFEIRTTLEAQYLCSAPRCNAHFYDETAREIRMYTRSK